MRLNNDQRQEIEELRRENGGLLRSEQILERARSANSSLHTLFEWDDTEAARRWREAQARQVVRAVVTYAAAPDGTLVAVRAFVHDPAQGGYRATAEVMADEDAAAELFQRLAADLRRTLSRYHRYAALAPAIAAVHGLIDQPPGPA